MKCVAIASLMVAVLLNDSARAVGIQPDKKAAIKGHEKHHKGLKVGSKAHKATNASANSSAKLWHTSANSTAIANTSGNYSKSVVIQAPSTIAANGSSLSNQTSKEPNTSSGVVPLKINASANASSDPKILRVEAAPVVEAANFSEAPHAMAVSLPAAVDVQEKKVKIEIFYETKCPSCQAFISRTLNQVWEDEEFRRRIKVHFYPYGNAQTLRTHDIAPGYKYWHEEMDAEGMDYMFPCQHGPDECFGNMLQACAIDSLNEQAKIVPFIICMETFSNKSLELAAWDCGNEQGVDLQKIKTCMQSSHGNRLMYKFANHTDTLASPAGPKAYVPWITIDGIHAEAAEKDGGNGGDGHGFLKLLCTAMSEPRPVACNATFFEAALTTEIVHSGAHSMVNLPLALLFGLTLVSVAVQMFRS